MPGIYSEAEANCLHKRLRTVKRIVVAASAVLDGKELAGIGNRQGTEHDRVHKREFGGGSTDSQS
jgi:hypothetical protein